MPDTAQFILNRLTEWGIKRVYGYAGDGIIGLLGAFHQVGVKLEFTQVRHEEIASFAARAHIDPVTHGRSSGSGARPVDLHGTGLDLLGQPLGVRSGGRTSSASSSCCITTT